jgi:hypothetical protein
MRIIAESRGMQVPGAFGGMGGAGGVGQDASGRTVVQVTEEEKAAIERVIIEKIFSEF